jgi:hypothetical protein
MGPQKLQCCPMSMSTETWFSVNDIGYKLLLFFSIDIYFRETLIDSEFPQHKDMLPYSKAVKPLNMKKKVKSLFTFFVL